MENKIEFFDIYFTRKKVFFSSKIDSDRNENEVFIRRTATHTHTRTNNFDMIKPNTYVVIDLFPLKLSL